MLPVEILPVQESLVLRARGSELLILPHHVKSLKGLTKSREFSQYFRDEALVNRPARKLFEAWLRKDHSLWQRIYTTIHKQMKIGDDQGEANHEGTLAPSHSPSEPITTAVATDAPSSTGVAATVTKAKSSTAKSSAKKDKLSTSSETDDEAAPATAKKKTSVKKDVAKTDSAAATEEPKKKASSAKKPKEDAEKPAKKTAATKKTASKTPAKTSSTAKSKSKG